ncbi:MAG: DUF4384 domain-containing protein [Magnetococcus sp. DMHC-6]
MKKNWRLFHLVAILGVYPLGLTGCATDAPVIEMKETEAVTTRQTDYDEVIYNFGKLLRTYTGRSSSNPMYFQIKPINNDTAGAGLPSDITRMVTTAVNKIGMPIVNVPYDPQYMSNEINIRQGIRLTKIPNFVISGAITEFDKDVSTKGTSKDMDISIPIGNSSVDAGTSNDNDFNESRMTIDFSMLDYVSQTSLGALTSNTINIKKESKSSGWSFSIFGSGIGMSGSASKSQGVHAAIRQLVEVSVVQLLGRQFAVPYWRLIPGSEPDKRLVRQIEDSINEDGSAAIGDLILGAYGYFQDEYPRNSSKAIDAVNVIFKKQNIHYTANSLDNVPSNIWLQAYLNIPIADNIAKHIKIVREIEARGGNQATSTNLQILLSSPKKEYKVGESMIISLNLTENAYTYCFWEQGNHSVIKIFPNRFNQNALLKQGGIELPDGNMPFSIVFDYPNSVETIQCFAATTDVTNKLPSVISGADLEVIQGYNMNKISSSFSALNVPVVDGKLQLTIK